MPIAPCPNGSDNTTMPGGDRYRVGRRRHQCNRGDGPAELQCTLEGEERPGGEDGRCRQPRRGHGGADVTVAADDGDGLDRRVGCAVEHAAGDRERHRRSPPSDDRGRQRAPAE
jgi:hypothetical protein